MESIVYATALRQCPGLGNKAMYELLEYFQDAKTAWSSIPQHYRQLGWSDNQLELFINHTKKTSLEKIAQNLSKQNIKVVTIFDSGYPQCLKEIYNPPAMLFLKGRPLDYQFCIAVVGSRRPTAYGKVAAEKLAEDLAANGVTVVSGLARGIDALAHKGALLKGQTVAVMGCGVDVIYPRENLALYQEIIANGTIVSEFPPGTPPEPGHFPARNRIISGLTRGVVVVEAAQKSGSLITANLALEQGRDVFAVPGPITSKNSEGTHALIKNGAKLVCSVQDILEEYEYEFMLHENFQPIESDIINSMEGKQILEILTYQPMHIDEILEKSKLQMGVLSKILTQLEVNNHIRQIPGQYYVLDKVNMR